MQATQLLPCRLHTCHLTLRTSVPGHLSKGYFDEWFPKGRTWLRGSLFAFIVWQREEGLLFPSFFRDCGFCVATWQPGVWVLPSVGRYGHKEIFLIGVPPGCTGSSTPAHLPKPSSHASPVLPPWSRSVPLGSLCFFEHQLLFGGHICFMSLFHVLWVERNELKSFSGCLSVFSHSSAFMNLMVCYLVLVYSSQLILLCILPFIIYYLLKSGLPWPT